MSEWHFGAPIHHWFSRIDPIETIHESPQAGHAYQLDLLVRDIYFEAYVDGIWRFSRVVPHHARQGTIGFFVDAGTALFENIHAWKLEAMPHAFRDSESFKSNS
jgi:hypothetical protein